MRTILQNFLLLALLFLLPLAAYGQCTDADTGELDINPPIPADGSNYPGGTVVEMCFTLNQFNTPSINWLHSIIPSFGPGFDPSSFVPVSVPTSCAGTGNWAYYDSWTSCALGMTWGPGFAFDGTQNVTAACGGTPGTLDGDPGNNWGDGGFLCANREWCWEITTVPVSPFSCQLINYNTTIFVYGDAETGNYNPPGPPPCLEDNPVCEPGLENLVIEQQPSPCGCTTVNAVWDNQVLGQQCGLNVLWTGPGGFSSTELNPEVCQSGVYELDISINNCAAEMAQFFVQIVGTNPVVSASATPSPVCEGDDITFTATGAGAGGTYSWNINGTAYTGETVTIPATGSGAENAIVTATNAQGCESEPATIFYVVLPIPNTDFTVNPTSLCTGETTIVNGNTSPGDESWDFGGATVLSGSGNGPYEISFSDPGIYTIYYEKANTVCAGIDSMEIEVFETPMETMVECAVSADDSITFNWDGISGALEYEISVDGGPAIMVTDTFYGVGGLINGATVTVTVIPVGNPICPLPPSASATCTVFSCPTATLDIDQGPQDFCLTGNNPPLDLTFSGSGFGTLADTSWTGPGVIGTAFFPDSAGLGIHTVTLVITNEPGCTYTDDVVFTVLPLPTADFTVTDTICSTATSLVTYTGNADPATSTFNWDFAGGNIVSGSGSGPYEISWALAGNYLITLTVEDDQNCTSTEFDQTVTVFEPLPVPSPGCGVGGLDSVSFNWLDIPGATGYVIVIDGGAPDTISGTTYGVGGLDEGDAVMMTIFALGDAPCGNSADTTVTCVAEACPDLTLVIDEDPGTFCIDDNPGFIVLGIAQNTGSGTGTYVWSGPGVSNDTFYIGVAGLGMHEISVTYSEGLCDYDDVATFTVSDTPQSAFSLSDTTVCEGQAITVTNEVAGFPAADYQWDFTGSTPASASGIGPHVVTYATAGTYTITQMVTDNGCTTSSTIEVTVVTPLTAPVVSCDPTLELEQITFNWTAVDPNVGYEVTIDGVVVDTVNALDYTLIGLTPDTSVTLSVRALGDGVCGDGPASADQTCFTASCPVITLTPTITQDSFCLGSNDAPATLDASSAGGDMTGAFTWSGPGVIMAGPGFAFDPVLAGLGSHVLTVDYVETAGCSATASLTVEVFETPTPGFTISASPICVGQVTTVTYAGTADVNNATFDWDFGAATVTDLGGEVYELSYATGGNFNVTLAVTENGCTSSTQPGVIVVEEPLLATMISCTDQDLTSVTFEWTAVTGATAYQVAFNGNIDTVMILSQIVTGLEPGEDVTITVTPLGSAPCGNGPASSDNCEAASCPEITVTPSAGQTAFCLDQNPSTTVLSATSSGGDMTGTFVWSGPGVSLVGMDYIFDPTVTGNGSFDLTVEYEETAGCDGTATLTMNVFEVPTADFTLSPETLCTDRTTLVEYVGTASPAANYDWDFDGATVVDLGGQSYELSWPTAGTYNVSLTVSEAGCSSSDTVEIEAFDPLADPEPICLSASYTSVTFGWDAVPNATGYFISINGGDPFLIDSTTFSVFDLLDDESITIFVTAQGPLPCGDSEVGSVSCSTDPCPDVSLTPAAAQDAFCAGGDDDPTPLTDGLSGSSGGEISWSGTGVITDGNGNFFFDPDGLAPATYTLTVTYTESICIYSATVDVTINAVPTAVIEVSEDELCTTATTVVSYTGTASPAADYDWDFDGATVVDLGGESYELSWPTAGIYTISLTVSEAGCSSSTSTNVEAFEPLLTPEPTCSSATFTSVTFGWNAVANATGYLISINNGAPFLIDSTSFTVSDLMADESVTIAVTAQGPLPCGNSEVGTVSCSTDRCPDVTLAPTAAQDAFCVAGGDDPTPLNAGLSGSSGGAISWTGSGVEQDNEGNYLFNPAGLAPGVYPLTVSYTESVCTYSATIDLTINAVPSSAITATADNFCTTTTTTVSFAGTAASDAVFNWDFDGAVVTDLGNQSYELNWNESGNYQVELTVAQNGCSDDASFNLSVTTPPVAGVQSTPAAVCENGGDLVEMSELITGASPAGSWAPAEGAPPAALDPLTGRLNTAMLPAGSYEYLYTVDGGVCDDAVTSVFVTVEPAPIANAGMEQLLTCEMGMVSLNGSGSSGSGELTFLWTGPDGQPVLTNPTSSMIDVATPGIYTLTVSSEIGCSASADVTVEAEIEVPVPQIELSNISCFGSTDGTILIESVDGGRPPYSYALNDMDFGTTNFFTGLEQGEYNVRVTDANGCFTELFLGLTRPDELSVSVELPNDETIFEEGELVTMVANISGGNAIDTLIWQPDTLNMAGEGFSNVITFPADDSRTIGVTVIDENGCMATDQTNIIVRKERTVYFPTGFSPNGDNVNDILFIGANEDKVELIQEYQVFNRWGESVFENYDFLPNEPAQGWDGNHRGEPMNPQVFVYYAKVLFRNGDEVIYKGDITLIR